ncbi:MAG: hypothetical protein DRJ68_03945 [Thermoprotei archaeon]|nr:MAG: hypothetical protein DRJ68_03945 [Thermoprotei archaeon]
MMRRIRESRGSIMKIEGPASVQVLEGAINVLGTLVKPKEKVVIPKYKSLSIEFVEDSTVELRLGSEAKVEKLPETMIPSEWRVAVEGMLSQGLKPFTCIVLGDVDSGKTTFCTYFVNYAVSKGLRVGVIDKDPGQTEISVPTTIGLGVVDKPIYSLEQVSAVTARFIGSTSPAGVVQRVVTATKQLYDEALRLGCDLIIINTSGWVNGRGARELKYGVISMIHPNYVVLIQRSNEVEHLVKPFEKSNIGIIRVQPSPAIKPKSRDDRRVRRESTYRNYFAKAKVRKLNLSSVKFMFTLFTTGARLSGEALAKYGQDLSLHLIYGEESRDSLLLVSSEPIPDKAAIESKARELYEKEDLLLTWKGEERGLIVGLLAPDLSYLGLGLIREIDYVRRSVEILTPVEDPIGVVQAGLIKLDEDFREVAKYEKPPL